MAKCDGMVCKWLKASLLRLGKRKTVVGVATLANEWLQSRHGNMATYLKSRGYLLRCICLRR